jgi:uncharacterized protein (AIM24 family)
MAQFEIIEYESQKFIKATINNETIRAEAGALHYYHGSIDMVSKAPSAGGILKSMVSGETVFKPTYTGSGYVYFGPPMFGEYVMLQLNNEEWILDQGAYVCSDIGIEVSARRNKALTALMGGEGLFQTSVKGTGTVVMKAPGKVQRIQMQGERMAVDGSFAVARSATLDFSVQRASKSLMGSVTSGEGLLNVYQGYGVVLLAPVPNLYQSVVNAMRAVLVPPQQQAAGRRASPLGCLIVAALLACGLGVAAVLAILANMGLLT